jgi:pyruvate ferredoxin oxidoreductase gamma subunit/phenylglyoxylate dehydrogenase gamma subunit
VLASKILAKALVEEGRHVTAIPAFGFERRGAPVAAFLRYDDAPLRAATNIYHPDFIICIDPTVARAVDIFAGVKPGGTLVQATGKPLQALALADTIATVALCDAVAIGLEIFAKPITNSIMLGAFARATGIVSLESLERGLESANFRDAGLEQNLRALGRGYRETLISKCHNGGWT